MTKFPFQLSIHCIFPKNKKEILTCRALLRVIPGNRDVYEASWNDSAVIAKVFSHKIKAKRHLRREWRGLNLLQERRLSSIKPLFYGRTDDGRWAVVVEKILDSVQALEFFDKITEKARKFDLLRLICKEIARQHEKGILQRDLHLGNFLLRGEEVFSLDPGQMQFFSHPISRKIGLSQLATLACFLPDDDTVSVIRLCDGYILDRGWQCEKSDERFLQKQRTVKRRRAIRKGLKKTLRTSKRYQRIRVGEYYSVYDRDFISGADPVDFMGRIDMLMDAGNVLKNGSTCYVSHILWNNNAVVVKRYNHRSFIHSIRHTIKRSRARRGWLHGHRLEMFNIRTPKPLAYIEKRRGPFVWKSYLVTEYIGGQKLHDFLQDTKVNEDLRSKAIQQVMDVIDRLGKYRITHGDLKHTNILIVSGPVLTDLDSMQISCWNWLYKRRRAKDISRFSKPKGH
jgi:tRNA A-37 threonylcarbamoyl transferase component Bud32